VVIVAPITMTHNLISQMAFDSSAMRKMRIQGSSCALRLSLKMANVHLSKSSILKPLRRSSRRKKLAKRPSKSLKLSSVSTLQRESS